MMRDSCLLYLSISSFERLNHQFEFRKRRQLFICAHNVTLSVSAMGVCNPDRSPVGINGGDAASTPTGFAEIVSDYLPVPHKLEHAG
jgi:hypothetical protein